MKIFKTNKDGLYPIITKSGSFGEVKLSQEEPSILLPEIEPINASSLSSTSSMSHLLKREYVLIKFQASPIKGRYAQVKVYVAKDIFPEIREDVRDAVIDHFCKQNSAWLFTYGERFEKETYENI